jgi:hypothetical protein
MTALVSSLLLPNNQGQLSLTLSKPYYMPGEMVVGTLGIRAPKVGAFFSVTFPFCFCVRR